MGGVFALQYDDLPYVVPNQDSYFFEVDMGNHVKPLFEQKRGEWDKLIAFSCMFPRYDIGDVIEASGKKLLPHLQQMKHYDIAGTVIVQFVLSIVT